MVWMGKEPLQRPQGIASRDGMRIPPGPLPSSASLQLLAAKGPTPSQPSVGPRPQSRLACSSRPLKPGKTPADKSSVHFTSPRHSPSVLSVGAGKGPFPPRLVSKLPFLERAPGPDRSYQNTLG